MYVIVSSSNSNNSSSGVVVVVDQVDSVRNIRGTYAPTRGHFHTFPTLNKTFAHPENTRDEHRNRTSAQADLHDSKQRQWHGHCPAGSAS